LAHTKGYRWGRKSKYKAAKEALLKAWTYAYRDRKVKKRFFRGIWQNHISSATKAQGLSYSKFMKKLKDNHIELDRKILDDLSVNNPKVFEAIIKKVKGEQ